MNNLYKKVAKRLYSLVMLKRAALSINDMVTYYIAMIRPVMEYCCQVWHSRLTTSQTELLESVQKRALRIIYSSPHFTDDYGSLLQISKLETLYTRRHKMCMKLFSQMQCENHKLFPLLVPYKNVDRHTRVSKDFKVPLCRTNPVNHLWV